MKPTKTCFITGGLGFVGQQLSKTLLDEGHKVVIYDNGSLRRSSSLSRRNNCRVIYGDIRDNHQLKTALQRTMPDVIIHLAALHYIPYCDSHPDEVLATNVQATQNLIDGIRTLPFNPLLVFASSASVYGVAPLKAQLESATPTPCDIYGHTKAMGEYLIRSQLQHHIIVRLFNVAGPGDPHPHLLTRIAAQLHPGAAIELGNPHSMRDFIHVNDVARGFIAAAMAGLPQETYNLGSGRSYSVKDVAAKFATLYPHEISIRFLPNNFRATDPQHLQADSAKLQHHTGWHPILTLDDAINDLLAANLAPERAERAKSFR